MFDERGKLKRKTACITCVVKSALDPKVIYDKVICSVCRGTGQVDPMNEGTEPQTRTPQWLPIAAAAAICALVFLAYSAITANLEARKYKDQVDALTAETERASLARSTEEVQAKLKVGMSALQVRHDVGEPDIIKQLGEAFGDTESWRYNCTDGHVLITMYNGAVQTVSR